MSLIGDYYTTQLPWTHVAHERTIGIKERREKGMSKRRPNKPLGAFIAQHRRAAGITVLEAADAAAVDPSFWRKLEHGVYESPSPKMLAPIARVIDAPLADVYALAGYAVADQLPTLTPYLRSKYQLPPKALAELQRYFDYLRHYYGVPDNQPVYPRQKRAPGKPGPKPQARPSGGPWDDPTVAVDHSRGST
jgi:transcriptional regulator with XRE-family HTH domain